MPNIPFFLNQERENLPGNNVLVTQPVGFIPPPPASEWTWVNQGPFTAEDIPGALQITITDDTDITIPVRLLIKDNLPDPPWTITMCFDTSSAATLGTLVLFNDSTGELITTGGGIISYFDDFSTFVSSVAYDHYGPNNSQNPFFNWVRLSNDGSNFFSDISTNGTHFFPFTIAPNNEFTIPTQFGIGVSGLTANPPYPHIAYVKLVHFELTTP